MLAKKVPALIEYERSQHCQQGHSIGSMDILYAILPLQDLSLPICLPLRRLWVNACFAGHGFGCLHGETSISLGTIPACCPSGLQLQSCLKLP